MKNFSTYIDKKMIKKIISSHNLGHVGNAIDPDILKELTEVKEEYLTNLNCSDECKTFIDKFLTDVKMFKENNEGSNFAENFVNL